MKIQIKILEDDGNTRNEFFDDISGALLYLEDIEEKLDAVFIENRKAEVEAEIEVEMQDYFYDENYRPQVISISKNNISTEELETQIKDLEQAGYLRTYEGKTGYTYELQD